MSVSVNFSHEFMNLINLVSSLNILCVCECKRVCSFVCECVYTYVYIYLCICAYAHVFVYVHACMCVHVCIYTILSLQVGYDTKSIFKRSKARLNSEFSFSLTCCLTKAKEPSLSNDFPITGWRRDGIMSFLREWNTNSFVKDLNSGHRFYFQ